MYKMPYQLTIDDFVFPYGSLKADNRWVRLAGMIPWDGIEREYAAGFADTGAPAHPARMALGALIVKQVLSCSDEELCRHVEENPYIQFFLGLKEFSEECPFGASTMVAFRKRFSEKDVSRINEMVLGMAKGDAGKGGGRGTGGGEVTLALDATVAPSDIAYPQDVRLLNEARERLEAIVDRICLETGAVKPRMYRREARRHFLNWSKSKKRGAKKTRKAVRKQLGYVRRDLGYIDSLMERHCAPLKPRQKEVLATIRALFDQQSFMYENKVHSVPDRIVSISQPWVRPIVRGKTCANTEFGAKVHVSTDDGGMARADKVAFRAFNESELLQASVKAFFEREGRWPDRVLADQIYRTRGNIAWCKERGIRLSGPRLGRPPKDAGAAARDKAVEARDAADRNVVEGVFGTVKTAYGMDPVKARLEETTRTVISLAVLVFNLKKLLAASLCLVPGLLTAVCSRLDAAVGRLMSLAAAGRRCLSAAAEAAKPVFAVVTE